MSTLNLGILAHVDAGKTTLTERLLHAAGVIDEIGSVDDGSTQTDTLTLERQRGITIKFAVVSFVIDDVTVNLIDTPGHPDFIAEVERVLSVLDGAVLVVSAVEGVQAQTRVLMRALKQAGTTVCEPFHRFHLEIPADTFGPTVSLLSRLRAFVQTQKMLGTSCMLEGEVPAARVHELQQRLPALTGLRRGSDPATNGPQPARPQGIPAARRAAGLAKGDTRL
jgi:small GTP-binding protein